MSLEFHKIIDVHRDLEIPVRTISGFRFRVRASEISRALKSPKWFFVFAVTLAVMIVFMPNNTHYNFSWLDRVVFWPLMSLLFLGVYLAFLASAARRIQSGKRKVFFSSSAAILATLIATFFGNIFGRMLSELPIAIGWDTLVNLMFNIFLVLLVEIIYYLTIVSQRNHTAGPKKNAASTRL